MRPTLIASFFPSADLGSVPADVEGIIIGIMERAAV